MKRYQYTCRLLSDLIISSVTATEGFNPSLDYIPGAKFLGIAAAKLYDEKSIHSLALFHNGKVRFGDANPIIEGNIGYSVPFSLFFEKGKSLTEPPVYLHHKLHASDFQELTREGKQLKQARKGYFSLDGTYMAIDQDFAIRSAYNSNELRSEDGKMFGYFSLPKGSEWTFVVDDDTENYAEQIKSALIGRKRIGRSRSAEYGLLEITFNKELHDQPENIPASDLTLIYAYSNLCFYDAYGRTTITPPPSQLGVPGGKIIWSKSQIRSRLYQTWNRHRHNRDADRMIIEKGSVFAISHETPIDPRTFINGIGSHKSEGFGQVLLNPDFLVSTDSISGLTFKRLNIQKKAHLDKGTTQPSAQDIVVLNYLNQRQSQESSVIDLNNKINKFLNEYGTIFRGISSSQWGTIRAYANHAENWNVLETLLFDKDFGALHRGQSEADWRKTGRREKLYDFLKKEIIVSDRVTFTLKLAAEMAKRKPEKESI